MTIYKTYVQQLGFDGETYTKGSVVDLLNKFNIACQEFPYKRNPKSKDLPTRDWAGEDGLDVYIPEGGLPTKSYDIDVEFIYVGTEESMREDLAAFIDFITGRAKADPRNEVQSGRLAIYDEHVQMGRKDVVVSEIDNELYYRSDFDNDKVARFKVKFNVYDPTTEVTLSKNGDNVTGLVWNE